MSLAWYGGQKAVSDIGALLKAVEAVTVLFKTG